MLATAATAATAVTFVHGPGFVFFPFFFLIPLFWILLLVALLAVFGRRRRRWMAAGAWQGRSAETTLAERYANGDIDEVEYRARLEVLRANREPMR